MRFVEILSCRFMLNSKVIDILKSFSVEEIRKFSGFLSSPFHNKNKKVIQLFEILSKYHPHYGHKNLTKEKLFTLIFSGSDKYASFSDASVRNLLSDLMILAEKFLVCTEIEKNKFLFSEISLKELGKRKLTGIYEKRLKTAESLLSENVFRGEEDYYKKFILEESKSTNSQYIDNLSLHRSNYILKASDNLTYYYLIRIFKMINFFEWQKQYNIDHTSSLAYELLRGVNLKEIEKKLKSGSSYDCKVITVYIRMYSALTDPLNDEKYFSYKNILTENDSVFSSLEKYGLYICLTNCCVRKIDLGKEYFNKECFEVYKLMFRNKLFDSYPGYFSMTTYTAILNTGLASENYDEIENFIENYSGRLNPEHREDAVNYSYAQLCFYKKQYGKSLEFISRTDTEFSNFKYHLKVLALKIYYETEDYDSLYYAADSFSHFINKNKIVSGNYREEFRNFLRTLDLLVKYRLGKDDTLIFRITKLTEGSNTAGRKWLKKKFGEIK
ncbi:MAG: hypothetical protein JST15_03975 [Bacteroidetes bacterium]|nr:hypothetical protein [Bacteroidota bacterium]